MKDSKVTAKTILKTIMSVDACTKCEKKFEVGDERFPYPEKQVLCKECFFPSLKAGIARLNKKLNEG